MPIPTKGAKLMSYTDWQADQSRKSIVRRESGALLDLDDLDDDDLKAVDGGQPSDRPRAESGSAPGSHRRTSNSGDGAEVMDGTPRSILSERANSRASRTTSRSSGSGDDGWTPKNASFAIATPAPPVRTAENEYGQMKKRQKEKEEKEKGQTGEKEVEEKKEDAPSQATMDREAPVTPALPEPPRPTMAMLLEKEREARAEKKAAETPDSEYAHLSCIGRCWQESTDNLLDIVSLDCLGDDDDFADMIVARDERRSQSQLDMYLARGISMPQAQQQAPSSEQACQAV